jgi:transmembrane sensor
MIIDTKQHNWQTSVMDDYHILLKRYLNHTATYEERKVLFDLIETGHYDNLLGNDIHEDMDGERRGSNHGSTSEEIQKERLYRKLLSVNAIAPSLVVARAAEHHWFWIAATVVMLAVIGGVWYGRKPVEQSAQVQQAPTFKGKSFIHLPDGSTVLLNEGSELSYAFGKHGREVTLRGEAFFDVVHNPRIPFIVHSGKVNTRVLGTAFNVRAYPGQRNVKVTVSRGEVQVGDARRPYGSLKPNEQFIVDTEEDTVEKNHLNAERELTWRHNFLIFDNLTLGQAARILSEKYQVTIAFENTALETCRINAKFFNDEKLEEILSIMGLVLQFKPDYADPAHIIIRGKGCN